jgi:hypothetical protein
MDVSERDQTDHGVVILQGGGFANQRVALA